MTSFSDGQPTLRESVGEIVFDERTLQERIAGIGQEITRDYRGKDLILVGVLHGVVMFMADLLRRIDLPVQVDFMSISHYSSGGSSGRVRITKDLEQSIQGRHVLFVEDVIDTGLTLSYLLRTLRTRRPASLEVCVLYDRPYRRLIDIPVAYQGFELPDRFVVGYGLDDHGRFRNLPYVGVLKDNLG